MVEPPDIVIAAIPALALAGPAVAAAARLLESTAGVGGGVTDLPLTTAGLVAALLVIVVAMFVVPRSSSTGSPRSEQH